MAGLRCDRAVISAAAVLTDGRASIGCYLTSAMDAPLHVLTAASGLVTQRLKQIASCLAGRMQDTISSRHAATVI